MIRDISPIRSANQKVNCELREWHELHRNNVSVIREIRSTNHKGQSSKVKEFNEQRGAYSSLGLICHHFQCEDSVACRIEEC